MKEVRDIKEIDRIMTGKPRPQRHRAMEALPSHVQVSPHASESFHQMMTVLNVHRVVLPWHKQGEYVICLHMQKVAKMPIEGPFDPRRPWIQDMVMAFQSMNPNPQFHATVEANVFLTPDEFEEWGRPFPGQNINLMFRPEKK